MKTKSTKKRLSKNVTADQSGNGQAQVITEFNSNKDLVSQSESVLESADDENETFQPNRFFQKKIKNPQEQLKN